MSGTHGLDAAVPDPWRRPDLALAALALVLMIIVALTEALLRPLLGRGVDNAPVIVQHLGLVMSMFGAIAAERHGHLTTLGLSLDSWGPRAWRPTLAHAGRLMASAACSALAFTSGQFVLLERSAGHALAYGLPLWWVQAVMPLGFAALSLVLAFRVPAATIAGQVLSLLAPAAGAAVAWAVEGQALPGWVCGVVLLALLAGSPVFAVLGLLAMSLFAADGLPLASVPLSHYQITVNPSLPALPMFTLAGLVFARTGAATRLGELFQALFGRGTLGTVIAAALLCSLFTAFTGGSGVTILALGGLLLPLLTKAGYPERRGIGLVTSASALGVLLAPSVPLIMVAVMARVPITDMFLAGVLPALVMVASLLIFGGFLRGPATSAAAESPAPSADEPARRPGRVAALWAARWELGAPVVAIGVLATGWATPMESAAITAAYAVLTQALFLKELSLRALGRCLADTTMIIGGVLLVLGMALALTNHLIDAGLPDRLIDLARHVVPDRLSFLLLLCAFLCLAAALMEIYAAIVVLVPMLLPLARSYGVEPLHFGIIFLAAMEVGFICPPAGMNLYFAASIFRRPVGEVARSVGPALLAILIGTCLIALLPELSQFLPGRWGASRAAG